MPNSPSPDPDDVHNESTDLQPSMTIHPLPYSGMPMHMYPFPPGLVPSQPTRSKRRQVKNACTNCQKACKKCDDARPCLRCVKYGIAEECIDSHRKERKKGIKRGPYKKRDGKNFSMEPQYDGPSVQQPVQMTAAMPGAASPMPFIGPVGFPPGFYSQYPAPPQKPGDPPMYYPQFYIAPMPPHGMPPHPGSDGEGGYPPQFYPATFIAPYTQPYAPYMMHPRPDGQMIMPPGAHFTYPPIYPRPATPPHDGTGERRENRGEDSIPNH